MSAPGLAAARALLAAAVGLAFPASAAPLTDDDMAERTADAAPTLLAAPAFEATPLAYADLAQWAQDDHAAAFSVFTASCRAILDAAPQLRPGLAPSAGLVGACEAALAEPGAPARLFFETRFTPWRIRAAEGEDAFYTGYYEPEVDAVLTPTPGFAAPLRARPADLVAWPPGAAPADAPDGLAAARRRADGALVAMPTRAEIDAGALANDAAPIAFVRDAVEAFMIQVQGSARLKLPDGRVLRAVYDGRNGWPYTSIGRVLTTERGLAPQDVTLEKLKAWVRAAGQNPGEDGLALLHRNRSFVFFRLDASAASDAGPIGAQGLRLTRLRSIAVDRTIWPYGTPVWIDATLPWRTQEPTRLARLTVAQDTGSAILGPARADIFHGSGGEAGLLAGATRHRGAFVALIPKGESPAGAIGAGGTRPALAR